MAYSYVSYTGDGSTQNYTLPFSYISKTDITVTVNEVPVPFTWNSTSVVRITTAPAAASAIQIQRVTQKATVPVNFTDGSTLLESDLDTLALYVLYVAQEQADFPPDSAVAAAAAAASAVAAAASAVSAAASSLSGASPTVQTLAVNRPTAGIALSVTTPGAGEFLRLVSSSGPSTVGFGVAAGDISVFYTGGIERFRYDQTKGLLITNSGGIGYGTGAGGTVSQPTNKFTSVALNKATGQITLNAALLAAGATANFILNNSAVTSADVVVPCIASGVSNAANYNVWAGFPDSGSVQIYVKNISGGSLSEAAVLNFVVIKGAST